MNTAVSDVIAPAIWTLRDGTVLTLRHICATDIELMVSFVRGLSFGARYFRFGHGDIEFSDGPARRIRMNACIFWLCRTLTVAIP